MQVTSMHFKATASAKLANANLQSALKRLQGNFVRGRADRVAELGNYEEIRSAAAAIRDRALADLDALPRGFERNAMARGAIVHWAETREDVNRIVCDIARRHGVKKAVKSKSMVSEECALNDALEAAGVEVVETDLGEYILQLAKEPPSHIVAPVVHKTRDEVSDLFEEKHGTPRKTDIAELTREAREMLRRHFLTADMGISGANFLVAETGSTLIVTNEGNGRLVTTLPRVHVAITGIEKVVPTLEDVATLMRLLPPHGTGQTISNYISVTTGVRGEGDRDGPEHFHVILLDGGRTSLLGGDLQPMLRCIRCGACMNHCPVYQSVGGHAYGWVYPGPMGSVLTPTLRRAGERARPAECRDVLQPVRRGVPGEDPAAGPHAQAARAAVRAAAQAVAGAAGTRAVELDGAAPGDLCHDDRAWRAPAVVPRRRGPAHPLAAVRRAAGRAGAIFRRRKAGPSASCIGNGSAREPELRALQ